MVDVKRIAKLARELATLWNQLCEKNGVEDYDITPGGIIWLTNLARKEFPIVGIPPDCPDLAEEIEKMARVE